MSRRDDAPRSYFLAIVAALAMSMLSTPARPQSSGRPALPQRTMQWQALAVSITIPLCARGAEGDSTVASGLHPPAPFIR